MLNRLLVIHQFIHHSKQQSLVFEGLEIPGSGVLEPDPAPPLGERWLNASASEVQK